MNESSWSGLLTALRKCGKKISTHQIIEALDTCDHDFLWHGWPLWTRSDQTPPDGDWRVWLMLGGRGAGKTRAGAEWVWRLANASPEPVRIALVGPTYAEARMVMIEGVSGLLAIGPPRFRPVFEASKRQLVWPNGSLAQVFSAEEPESLRGSQFHAAWCDELAKWRYLEDAWDMLQFGLRLGTSPRVVVTTTPRPVPLLKKLLADKTTRVATARTSDNAMNLSRQFLAHVEKQYGGTRLGRQELEGELIVDYPGALFTRSFIEQHRLRKTPSLARVVVAIDPPASDGKKANACGIICAGLGYDGRAYVLEDATLERASPAKWAAHAVKLYHEQNADRVVAEVNQGGAMVEAVLRQIEPQLSYRAVHASRGKTARAEPVAALYEQGRVSHVGSFAALEDEMCQFEQIQSSSKSPDRVDALVWALHDLLLRPVDPVPRVSVI